MVFGTTARSSVTGVIRTKNTASGSPWVLGKSPATCCSYRKVVCTVKKGVRVCNRKSKVGKGKKPSKRARVEDLSQSQWQVR